jgi:hypothetical protein
MLTIPGPQSRDGGRPIMCFILLALLPGWLPPADSTVSLRYVRPSAGKFVLESRVTEAASQDGLRYSSLTDRGSEKMTLTLHFDAKHRLRRAEAVRQTGKEKQTATVVFKEKEAVLTRQGADVRLSVTPDVVVTTAPDWSDIFQVIRRYDPGKGGKQKFSGLWIHPVKDTRQLTFTVEPVKEDVILVAGKKVTLQRYRVTLRSGAYLVWADRSARVYRLMPPGKPGGAVILEGYETATADLR